MAPAGLTFLVVLTVLLQSAVSSPFSENVHSRVKRQTSDCGKIDLIFALDSSRSIGEENPSNWNKMLQFTINIINSLSLSSEDARVGYTTFSNVVYRWAELNWYESNEELVSAVSTIPWANGERNTSGVIWYTRQMMFNNFQGDRLDARNIILIMTNGRSDRDSTRTIPEAELSKEANITIIVIGIGDVTIQDEVINVASAGFAVLAPDFDSLDPLVDETLGYICDGSTRSINTVDEDSDCAHLDLCLVIDSSGSIQNTNPPDGSYDNWQLMLDFVGQIASGFDIGSDKTRVAVLVFSEQVRVEFTLTSFSNKQDVVDAITSINYMGSRTNTPAALRDIRLGCFLVGDRWELENLAIIVMDGVPFPPARRGPAISEAQETRSAGISIISIGITNDIDEEFLKRISGPKNSQSRDQILNRDYFRAPDFVALNSSSLATNIVERSCKGAVPKLENCGPVDLCIVIDSSGSVRDRNPPDDSYDNWDLTLRFVGQFINRFEIGEDKVRVGVITFSDDVMLEFGLDKYFTAREMIDKVMEIKYKGTVTNTHAALMDVRDKCFGGPGDRPEARNTAIIITDGVPFPPTRYQPAIDVAVELRVEHNIGMFSVGVTDMVDDEFLAAMSGDVGVTVGNQRLGLDYFRVPDFRSLDSLFVDLSSSVCFSMPTDSRITFEKENCDVVDLCIVLDSSGSIRDNNPANNSYDNWQLVLVFLEQIINNLEIAEDKTRVGLIVYSEEVILEFGLDTYFNAPAMIGHIRSVTYLGQTTNTPDALTAVREQCYGGTGHRPGAKNVAIVITDGVPFPDDRYQPAIDIAEELRTKNNIALFSVGITDQIDETFLAAISGDVGVPNGHQVLGYDYFKAADFQALDSMVHIVTTGICENPKPKLEGCGLIDLCVVIDSSGSIRDNNPANSSIDNWQLVLDFVQEIAKRFDISEDATHIAVLVFSEQVRLEFGLDSFYDDKEVAERISTIEYMGMTTNTPAALTAIREQCFAGPGDRPDAKDIAIIITDGVPFPDDLKQPAIDEAEKLRMEYNIGLYSVGVTDEIDEPFLAAISGDAGVSNGGQVLGYDYFKAADFNLLDSVLHSISTGVCKRAKQKLKGCDLIDLCIVIDSSGSIREINPAGATYDNWQLILDFTSRVTKMFSIGPDATRVGVVLFSENANVEFGLDTYSSEADIVSHIQGIQYIGETTNTAAALMAVRNQCFGGAGDRPEAKNIAFVITHGIPFPPDRYIPTLQQAEQLRLSDDIRVFALGITQDIDEPFLASISGDVGLQDGQQKAGYDYLKLSDFLDLNNAVESVSSGICKSQKPKLIGCNPVDLCIVIDSGESIRRKNPSDGSFDNWRLVLSFVEMMVKRFEIGDSDTRIGLIAFSDQANLEFPLDRYNNEAEMVDHIRSINYMGMSANTPAALNAIRNQCYGGSGDRPDAKNLALIITDSTPFPNLYQTSIDEAQRLRLQNNIGLYVIGIGSEVDKSFLAAISGDVGVQNGNQVEGFDFLTAPDFQALDSVLETVSTTVCKSPKPKLQGCDILDMCIVIDSSGSIRDNNPANNSYDNWQLVLDFVKEMVTRFNIGENETHVGLIVYSERVRLEFGLNWYYTEKGLLEHIDTISYLGATTNTPAALLAVRDQCFTGPGDRPNVKNVAVVITDGVPFPDDRYQPAIDEAQRLRTEYNIRLYSIGITDKIDESFLAAISGDVGVMNGNQLLGNDYFKCSDFRTLDSILKSVSTGICRSTTPMIECRQLDLCIVIDSSGSIRDNNPSDNSVDNWQLILSFVSEMIRTVDVGEDMTHVGLVVFSEQVRLEFPLDRYYNEQEMLQHVAGINYMGMTTNTPAAMIATRDQCFTGPGDRPGVKNVAFVITDGLPFPDDRNQPAIVEAEKLRMENSICVISCGITNLIDEQFLATISGDILMPNGQQKLGEEYHRSPDFQSLNTMLDSVTTGICEPPSAKVENCTLIDLCVVIDSSGSIRDNNPLDGSYDNWNLTLDFVIDVLKRFKIGVNDTHIGLIVFSENVRFEFGLDTYYTEEEIVNHVRNVDYMGQTTNTPAALRSVRQNCFTGPGERPNAKNVAIVITDGVPFPDERYQPAIEEAERLRFEYFIEVISVGITNLIDIDFLATISGDILVPNGEQQLGHDYFTSPSFEALSTLYDIVSDGICREPLPLTSCRLIDLCIVIDSSGSIRDNNPMDGSYDNWDLLLNFVTQIINVFDVKENGTRVGLIVFSEEVRLEFGLTEYNNAQDALDHVRGIDYMGMTTNTPDALRAVGRQCFGGPGDRANAKNVAIVISDGVPFPDERYQPAIDEAENLRIRDNVQILAFGITNLIDERFLADISGDIAAPKGTQRLGYDYFSAPDFQGLSNTYNALTSSVCRVPEENIECEYIDLCVVIDSSGSIRDNNPADRSYDNWELTLNFVKSIVGRFDIGQDKIRMGLIVFSEEVKLEFGLNRYFNKEDILNHVSGIEYMGMTTNTPDALTALRTQCFSAPGDRSDARNVAIVITDGVPFPDFRYQPALDEAQRLRMDFDISVFAVGISNLIDEQFLASISGDIRMVQGRQRLGYHYFRAPDFQALDTMYAGITSGICQRFNRPPAGEDCRAIDICFVIDSSGSIRDNNPLDGSYDNCDLLMNFLNDVASSFQIGTDYTRIGAVVFSEAVNLIFHLDEYDNKEDVVNHLSRIQYYGLTTNTPEALRVMREECFNPARGDRPDVPNLAIIITDGIPFPLERRPEGVLQAREAREVGINMVAVGITDVIDAEFLRQISGRERTQSGQQEGIDFFTTPDFLSLDNILRTLVSSACSTPDPSPECEQMDLCVIIDSSGSIRDNNPADGSYDNWALLLQFVSRVVEAFPIDGSDRTQIGVVAFSEIARLEFTLDTYQTKEEICSAIQSIPFLGQTTNTPAGIRLARTQCFNENNGDRPGAKNVAIVITDGFSYPEDRRIPSIQEAQLLLNEGVTLLAVGITNLVDVELLRSLSSPPNREGEQYFSSPDFLSLQSILREVALGACIQESNCTRPGDIAIVMDTSGSVQEKNFNTMKSFVQDLVRELDLSEVGRVGVVTYSTNAHKSIDMGQFKNKSNLAAAINEIAYDPGTTNTAGALSLVRNELLSTSGDRPNMIVLFTDGGSNDYSRTILEAAADKDLGIHIIVVAVGNWLNELEIKSIASYPSESNVFQVKNFAAIDSVRTQLKETICNDENECSSNPCRNGGTCVDAVIMYLCQCAVGYAGRNCELRCNEPSDVAFVFDTSTSMGDDNFYKMITFFKNLAMMMSVEPTWGMRVSGVTFAQQCSVRFPLDQYTTNIQVANALSFEYTGGSTNTAAALSKLREDVFTIQNGDRLNVRNMAIMLTDGQSNTPDATFFESQKLHEANITMLTLAVDLPNDAQQLELRGIVSDPNQQNLFNMETFDELEENSEELSLSLLNAMCNNVDECAGNPCLGFGSVCSDEINDYECYCASGRTGRNCERECDGKMDIIIMFDKSGSIRESRFNDMKLWLIELINNLEVRQDKTRIGMVGFESRTIREFDLNTFRRKEDLKQAVERTQYSRGKTNLAAAIREMRAMFRPEFGDRDTAPNFGILVSDGRATREQEATLPEAIAARLEGIHIIIAAPEGSADSLEFIGIASQPVEANIFATETFSDISSITNPLIMALCDDVNECDSNPCLNGAFCRNGMSSYICECRNEFTGRNCERRCTRRMDVVFILDASGSTEERFYMAQQITREIVYGLNFEGSRTRVGVLTFSDDAKVEFHLNNYFTQLEVLNAVAFLANNRGRTNTAEALRTATNTMFSSVNGDRLGDENVLIVLTDGRSNVQQSTTVPEATAAKRTLRLVSIGLGEDVNRREIEDIASDPKSENEFYLPDRTKVQEIANEILDALCR